MKHFFWGIIFLCFALSCSDESGTLGNPNDDDRNFTVYTEIFQKYLETQASSTFTGQTSGLTFTGEQTCGSGPEPSLYFDNRYYRLNATTCYYYFEPEWSYESFSIINSSLLSNGLSVYAVVTFLNQGIPETGTYPIEYFCDFFCYSTTSVRVYFIDRGGVTVGYYISYPTIIDVVNTNGVVTVGFDSDFYSGMYPYDDYAHGSANLRCCN